MTHNFVENGLFVFKIELDLDIIMINLYTKFYFNRNRRTAASNMGGIKIHHTQHHKQGFYHALPDVSPLNIETWHIFNALE